MIQVRLTTERKRDIKKWLLVIINISILILAACSDNPTPSEDITKSKQSTLSAEEVYEKAIKQLDSLESAAFNLSMEQTMNVNEDEQMTTKADVIGELIKEPFMSHLNGSISIKSESIGTMEINVEAYAQDETIYVYEDLFNNWINITMEDLANTGLEIDKEQSPFSHVKELDQYMDDFTFEQTNENYFFTLETNSDKLQQLILEEIQDFQLNLDNNKDVMEVIDIYRLEYAFIIDKETFNMLSFNIDFSINITKNNEKTIVYSTIKADFSTFNNISDITIPQDVLDEAVDLDDAFGF